MVTGDEQRQYAQGKWKIFRLMLSYVSLNATQKFNIIQRAQHLYRMSRVRPLVGMYSTPAAYDKGIPRARATTKVRKAYLTTDYCVDGSP